MSAASLYPPLGEPTPEWTSTAIRLYVSREAWKRTADPERSWPRSCWTTYEEYLATDWWRARRERALTLADHRCQVCNAPEGGLDVHHRTYVRIGNESDADLIALCRMCHDIFHKTGRLAR